jgi:uncharacterized protein YmfQ (DUF2313 family)
MDLDKNYTDALHKLLPRGVAWDFDKSSDNYKLLTGLTRVFADADNKASIILKNLLPDEADELINQWEDVLAIPDSLRNVLRSKDKRRTLISLIFADIGNQNISYYQDISKKLGVNVMFYDMGIADAQTLHAFDYLGTLNWESVVLANFDISKATANEYYADAQNAVAGDMLAYLINDNNDDVNALIYLASIHRQAHVKFLFDYYDKRSF